MKLELDLSNPEELRAKRDELMHAVRVIDAALGALNPQSSFAHTYVATMRSAVIPALEIPNLPLETALNALPSPFSVTALYSYAGNERREEVKALINRALSEGKIRVLEQGKGRKATIYEKIEMAA